MARKPTKAEAAAAGAQRAAYDAAVLAAAKPRRRTKVKTPYHLTRAAEEDFDGQKSETPAKKAKKAAEDAKREKLAAVFRQGFSGPPPAFDPHDPEDLKRMSDGQIPQELTWHRASVETARQLANDNPGDAACAAYLENEVRVLANLEAEAERPERLLGW